MGKGLEEGKSKESARSEGGVHGRCGVVEIVLDGRLGRERRGVGGGVFPKRETAPQEDMISHALFEAVWGLSLETGVYLAYTLAEEERTRTIRSRKRVAENQSSINALELLEMVMTHF